MKKFSVLVRTILRVSYITYHVSAQKSFMEAAHPGNFESNKLAGSAVKRKSRSGTVLFQ